MEQTAPTPSVPQSPEVTSPNPNQTPPNVATKKPKSSITAKLKTIKPITWGIVGLSIFVLIALIFILGGILGESKDAKDIADSSPDKKVEKEKDRQEEASKSAAEKAIPVNQLQKVYDDIVGSDTSKRTLAIDAAGIALIEYEVTSTNGEVILKTSYEHFADMANRVFNIQGVTRFNVVVFANKFTDQFGTPNVFAVKLQITKEKNNKINWPVKKYVYGDYATILDYHEINPGLQKDYTRLIED